MRARKSLVCWPRACRLSNDRPRPKSSSQDATSSQMMAATIRTTARISRRGSASFSSVWPIRRQSWRTRSGEAGFIMQNIVPMTRPALELRTGQHLALTPQLQQSIRLLQLSTLDLQAEIDQALADNPLLERSEERADTDAHPERETTLDDEPAREAETRADEMPGAGGVYPDDRADGPDTARSETLREHLLAQLGLTRAGRRDAALVGLLIDELDENGYLG